VGFTIGIDIGSITTRAAVMDGGAPQPLHFGAGAATMPSCLAFVDGGQLLVGAVAQRQAVLNPRRTVFGLKRLLGRCFASPEVTRARAELPFEVVAGGAGEACVRVDGHDFRPEQLQAVLLGHVREQAEDYLGTEVTDAILAVPAWFRPAQRQAVTEAAKLAGLRPRRLVPEPSAAALAAAGAGGDRIAVVDMGGTLDVCVLGRDGGTLTTRAAARDAAVGGGAFDQRLVGRLRALFEEACGIDLGQDAVARQRLLDAAEKAKRALSAAPETLIALPVIAHGPSGTLGLSYRLTRDELQSLCADLIAAVAAPCAKALAAAGLRRGEVDTLVVCGGMAHVPAVRAAVAEVIGVAPHAKVDPEQAVALGAALYARPQAR
jgi:molecular chaperone DnaK